MIKTMAMAAAAVMLTGCGSLAQTLRAYGTVAVEDAKAANDLKVDALRVGLCSLPYSTIQRNPDIKRAVVAACGEL